MHGLFTLLPGLAAIALAVPGDAQQPPVAADSAALSPSYATLADLVLAAPIVADAAIRSTSRLKPEEAPRLPPGMARLYVEADVANLIRAGEAPPTSVGYLLDVPLDPGGRPPKLKKLRVLLFARATATAGQIQLVRPDAQRAWSPAADATVRRLVKEAMAPDAAPAVTGIGHAFHVAGALPGEGETQIFLKTGNGHPVSLTIDRATDGSRKWSVALSEFVDAAAPPPQHDTFLWYRLACGLPDALPDTSLAGVEEADAAAAREDYGYVRQSLGRCDRAG